MKRSLAALIASLAASAAMAQTTAPAPAAPAAIPPFACEPKPVYPGLKAMRSEADAEKFRTALRIYQECMKAYIDERRAAIKANTDAANAAMAEHNAVIEKFRADQEIARKEQQEELEKQKK